jgi:hypothetical protein
MDGLGGPEAGLEAGLDLPLHTLLAVPSVVPGFFAFVGGREWHSFGSQIRNGRFELLQENGQILQCLSDP